MNNICNFTLKTGNSILTNNLYIIIFNTYYYESAV